MKIAALSDIHGNLAALDAVLADAAARDVDQLVNLGDICSGGLFPAETADRLMALGLPTIRGNHERQVLEGTLESMGLSDRYAAKTLRPEHFDWFARLPPTLRSTWFMAGPEATSLICSKRLQARGCEQRAWAKSSPVSAISTPR